MVPDPSLTDDEQLVLLVHPHWKTLIRPVLLAVLVVAIALAVEVVIPSGSAAPVARPGPPRAKGRRRRLD